MTRPFVITLLCALFVASGAFVARVPAQQQPPMQTELLGEVRLLRQAIEALAGTNARVQIVFGRLQLQEQRTASAAQRLDASRMTLTRITNEIMRISEDLKSQEAAIAEGRRKPEQMEVANAEVAMLRRTVDQLERERTRAVADEAEAASILNQEQGRWSDLNRQLDELERLLSRQQ